MTLSRPNTEAIVKQLERIGDATTLLALQRADAADTRKRLIRKILKRERPNLREQDDG